MNDTTELELSTVLIVTLLFMLIQRNEISNCKNISVFIINCYLTFTKSWFDKAVLGLVLEIHFALKQTKKISLEVMNNHTTSVKIKTTNFICFKFSFHYGWMVSINHTLHTVKCYVHTHIHKKTFIECMKLKLHSCHLFCCKYYSDFFFTVFFPQHLRMQNRQPFSVTHITVTRMVTKKANTSRL